MGARAEAAARAPGPPSEGRAVGAVLDTVRVALAAIAGALEPGARALAAAGAVAHE